MKVNDKLRQALLKWKENEGLSNRKIGEIVGVSAPAVGNWLTNDDAEIRNSNYEQLLPHIEKYVNDDQDGFIRNSDLLKNFILHKVVSQEMRLDDLVKQITFSNREDLAKMLSPGNTVPFTPKTLSEIFAILDIEPKDTPLSDEEKKLLFVDTIKKSLYYNTAPIVKQSFPLINVDKRRKRQYIGDFRGEDLIGLKMEDNSLWFKGVTVGDVLIFKEISSLWELQTCGIDSPIILLSHDKGNYIGEFFHDKLKFPNKFSLFHDSNYYESKSSLAVDEFHSYIKPIGTWDTTYLDGAFLAIGRTSRKFKED